MKIVWKQVIDYIFNLNRTWADLEGFILQMATILILQICWALQTYTIKQ